MKDLSTMSRYDLEVYLSELESDAGQYGTPSYENEKEVVIEINKVKAELDKRGLPMGGIERI